MTRTTQAQWTVADVIDAPLEAVWTALLEGNPYLEAADRQRIAASDQRLTKIVGKPGEGKMTVEVDPRQHSIAIQGEWWYRGVYAVEPDKRGSRIVYRVYNIAPGMTWWLAQLVQGRQNARTMPDQLQGVIHAVEAKLGLKNASA